MSEDLNTKLLSKDIDYIKQTISKIDKSLTLDYVTKGELSVVELKVSMLEKIVYGLVGVILIGVIGALLRLVVIS